MEAERQGELSCSTVLYYTLDLTTLHYTIVYCTTKPYRTTLRCTKLHFTKLEYKTKLEGNVVTYSTTLLD